jgi:E3 ubiquitin-protein ligase DOA10
MNGVNQRTVLLLCFPASLIVSLSLSHPIFFSFLILSFYFYFFYVIENNDSSGIFFLHETVLSSGEFSFVETGQTEGEDDEKWRREND